MQVIGNPGVDKEDFEFWSLAVSTIGGCGVCLESHEKVLWGAGRIGRPSTRRCGSRRVVNAAAVTLESESALATV
ncbi:hypothetical protein [Pseudonocardia asaccharolytica]|uniref:Carboxymuconolactone decarboxylase-like domain-containing protein n=1 Tax=Pseudonocardia asaccharolytica DSM 44247 = NBRC 16224 TaxID=1123024 RepID=A0A511D2L9_9PSEU|nr:hypothetical protein [Pseudonocardia asaccharolytica]GEL19010.1 hypothetical protein PA7_28470 [Pseudonocardia asaccharolytica DSM 44247 = NBRC 16224]